MGQRYRKMEEQNRGPGWNVTWILLKEKALNQKFPNSLKLGDVMSKLVLPKHITDGSLGAGRWAIFF